MTETGFGPRYEVRGELKTPDGRCPLIGGIMINEHDCVLTSDLPSEGLLSGDVGTVIHIHGNVSAYEVEFATLTGKTIAVATVLPSQCRPIGHRDINHVREVQAA